MNRQERTKKHQMELTLYKLSRQLRAPAQFYKVGVSDPNFATRSNTLTRVMHPIHLITFDAQQLQKFEYDIGYLAANKNFTYGGFYEPGDKVAILDTRESIRNLEIDKNDYFIFDEKRYSIIDFTELDYRSGYVLKLRHMKGQMRQKIITVGLWQRLTPEQENTNEIV